MTTYSVTVVIDDETRNSVIVHVGRDDDRREERQEGTTDD